MRVARSHSRVRDVERFAARAINQSGMLLLVTGGAGMGKTHFLRLLSTNLTGREAVVGVHYAFADEYEQDMSYSFIDRLFASGIAERAPIDRGTPADVAGAVQRSLLDLPADHMRAVLLDDAQWIDAGSLRVLRYVVPRVVRRGVFVVIAERSPVGDDSLTGSLLDLARATPAHDHVDLPDLTVRDVQAFAADRFGTMLLGRTAREVLAASGGTYLGLGTAFAEFQANEVDNLHLAWDLRIRWSERVTGPHARAFRALPPEAQHAVALVSLSHGGLSEIALDRAARALGEPVDPEPALRAGLVRVTGLDHRLVVEHPMIARVVGAELGDVRHHRVHRALATVSDSHESVFHALHGATEWSDDLETRVHTHLERAVARRDDRLASRILRGSLPLATGSVRVWLLEELGLLHLRNKSAFKLLDLVDEFEALPPSLIRDAILIQLLLLRFDADTAVSWAMDTLASRSASPDDRSLRSFVGFLAVVGALRGRDIGALGGVIASARRHWVDAPRDPGEIGRASLRWTATPDAFALIADCYSVVPIQYAHDMAGLDSAVRSLVPRVDATPPGSTHADAAAALMGALVALGDVDEALRLARAAASAINAVDKPWATGTIGLMHAHLLALTGRLTEAWEAIGNLRSLADDLLEVEARSTLSALQAWLAIVTQREDPAPYLAEAQRIHEYDWEFYGVDLVIMAECEMARSASNPAAVVAATQPDRHESLLNTQRGFLTYRAHALVELGRLDEAEELIDDLDRMRGVQWQEMWGSLTWLRAALAHARGDLDAALDLFARAGAEGFTSPLVEALTRSDHGSALVGAGRRDLARAQFQKAADLLARIGAQAYLPGVTAQLTALSDQEHVAHLELLSELTQRELEIARLLADGRSNKDIADLLVVSQATVRFHVSNVLRKLQIRSRSEVARVFRGPS